MRSPSTSRRGYRQPFPKADPSPRRASSIGPRQAVLVLLGAAAAGLAAGSWEAIVGPHTAEAAKPGVSPAGTEAGPSASAAMPVTTVKARFGLCHTGGGTNCVVDGDTVWISGEKVRVADIDAPETHPPRCASEARLGKAATRRLQALLNKGPVTLAIEDRDTDRYGRKLRVVMRGGQSLGEQLVEEGLARPWEGRRRPWC
ncbi:thermonuclease family protein [Sphingomonas sp. S2-65]|uniref:thermonuclease family protein n=1 Tax=Sphingomonas sp. S2-65 TaxID=2903960 RepID=UPI001F34E52F|nr:thermonuclease family protein [Sphingomonas sp. S2-65]UYY57933.1 thermonuclease family protein [Sphingomonas sp. S2-65]